MDTKNSIAHISTSWAASFSGAAIFVLWGLVLISFEIPHEWSIPTWVQTVLFSGLILLLPVGVGVGWIQNFPRWSYPYVGNILLFSLYLSRASTPGIFVFGIPIFGRELWGWRAWIPFSLIAIVALGITRSFRPIARFFTNLWNDWTLVTFGMFGFMPLMVFIGFDEIDRLYSLYFMVILSLLITGVALFYMRANLQKQKTTVLLLGIVLTTGTSIIAPNLYWQGQGWGYPWQTLIVVAIVVLFMFSPALIGLVNRFITRPKAG